MWRSVDELGDKEWVGVDHRPLPYAELMSTLNTTYFCYFRRVMHVSTYASRGLRLYKYVYMKEDWIASFSNEHCYRIMRQQGRFFNKHSGSFANKEYNE